MKWIIYLYITYTGEINYHNYKCTIRLMTLQFKYLKINSKHTTEIYTDPITNNFDFIKFSLLSSNRVAFFVRGKKICWKRLTGIQNNIIQAYTPQNRTVLHSSWTMTGNTLQITIQTYTRYFLLLFRSFKRFKCSVIFSTLCVVYVFRSIYFISECVLSNGFYQIHSHSAQYHANHTCVLEYFLFFFLF